jgi:site-specific DNA recombinase
MTGNMRGQFLERGEGMRAAIYTRFSSDKQREASSEDQRRNCERRAIAEGWEVVTHYKDEAISGTRHDRPAYQDMERDARARKFEVLLVEGLDRLARDVGEQERFVKGLEHKGLRIIGTADGYDSASGGSSRKLLRIIKGGINEGYIDDLRAKTHRGLEGQAMKGNNTGGRAFGYRHVPIEDPVKRDPLGRPLVVAVRREVDEVQAEIVRRIFAWYADGKSPRAIAEALNSEGVPSPGSAWNRARPSQGWTASAINGPMAGTGLLNNELYVGRYVWNRSQWVKNPETQKRERRLRPASDWITTEQPDLRIVPGDVWKRVKSRQKELADRQGARVRAGLAAPAASRIGPPGKYLFSSLLKCDVCGSTFVLSNRTHYACASMVNGRRKFCGNNVRVKRTTIEAALLRDIKDELASPEVVKTICAEVPKRLAALTKRTESNGKRVAELEAENARLGDSIGRMGGSATLEARLARNETELARLTVEANAPTVKIERLLPKLADGYRTLVADLGNVALRDVSRGRTELRRLYGGEIRLRQSKDGSHLEAAVPGKERLIDLAVANGFGFHASTSRVAGEGFEPSTFGL